MIYAYHEMYLTKAQALLGEDFDYAVNTCGIPGEDFRKMFCVSPMSKRIQLGDPACVAGKSGIELVRDIIREAKGQDLEVEPEERFGRSAEYWIGWAVAYYQWYSDRKFMDIFEAVPYRDLEQMYHTLHEADITKFVEIVDARVRAHYPETALKRRREIYGYTQKQLAEDSGVSLRSIQMYEQRHKDINKAGVETVYRLAKTLGCTVEDLIERSCYHERTGED